MKISFWFNLSEELYPQKFYKDRPVVFISSGFEGDSECLQTFSLYLILNYVHFLQKFLCVAQEYYLVCMNVFAGLVLPWLFLEAHLC